MVRRRQKWIEDKAGGRTRDGVQETGEDDVVSKGEEEGDVNLRALGALEFQTQDADPSGTMLIDTRNGFNEMSRLAMLWNLRHGWPAGAMFAFN